MRKLKQSTARSVMVFMTDSTDHITGKSGLTLTITLSKNGAAFSSISPTVNDRGSGWYEIQLTTGNTDTLGDLALHITSAGADPTDTSAEVVAYDPQSSTSLGLSRLDTTVGSRAAPGDAMDLVSGAVDATAVATGAIDADAIAANAITDAKINTGAITASKFAAGAIDAAAIGTGAIDADAIAAGAITSSEAPALAYLTGNVALDSTVAKENTLTTRIPTALSFTGANVNAESKVTAAPTDMALNSTVAKDATVSKAAGAKGTDDIHDTMALDATVAKSATALSNATWTDAKAGYLTGNVALDSTVAKEATLSGKSSQSSVDTVDTNVDTILADVIFLMRFFTNKKVWDDVNKEWEIYNDAGDTVIYHWKPKTKAGGNVTMATDAFASTDKVV